MRTGIQILGTMSREWLRLGIPLLLLSCGGPAEESTSVTLQDAVPLAGQVGVSPEGGAAGCDRVTEIEGRYPCGGECLITTVDPENHRVQRTISEVRQEIDWIRLVPGSQRVPGSQQGIYQIDIEGQDGFRETEIGALHGRVLRAATAEVSNDQYPVLEDSIFETDRSCRAVGYTKIVRNPSPAHFKVCTVRCLRKTPDTVTTITIHESACPAQS